MSRWSVFAIALFLAACPKAPPAPVVEVPAAPVPLSNEDPDYARADVASAIKPAGQGGISEGIVLRVTEDTPVYRLWSGPEKVDARGYTNRIGQWWTFEAPAGSQADYRVAYEICAGWNDLTWVATCTLKAGSVVAVGPGQSVSAETCGSDESYPANPAAPQVFIAKAWARMPAELDCPDASADYAADPTDLSKPKP